MASEHAHKIDGAVRKLRAVMEAFDMKGTNRATMLHAINTINALRTRPAPAATDTGLVTVGTAAKFGQMTRAVFNAATVPVGSAVCLRSQAEELLAAVRARSVYWAGQCGELCSKVEDLKADNAALTAKLETANALVTCCCGNSVDSHGMGDGHSPVDQYHYKMMQLEEQNAALTARIKELEEALDSDPSGSDLWRYWSRKAREASQKYVDEVDRAEALEAKLSAAEKALEAIEDHAARCFSLSTHSTIALAYLQDIQDEARAALGRKPS
ncbi:hypothetical protein Q5698_08520 [Brucella intermedia]|uniref:hypothetical protein n=1 Tax=Brucella intermedia TaxID=94625 RepID=UPI002735184F|nr:hypothetical protein [Brucella intermedia]WLF95713.1 hypothetical protein Q5698_08520 [Brucella intermedia]